MLRKNLKCAVLLLLILALLAGCQSGNPKETTPGSEPTAPSTEATEPSDPIPAADPNAIVDILGAPIHSVVFYSYSGDDSREDEKTTLSLDYTPDPEPSDVQYILINQTSFYDAIAGGLSCRVTGAAGRTYLRNMLDAAVFSEEPVEYDFESPFTLELLVLDGVQRTSYWIMKNGDLLKRVEGSVFYLAEGAADHPICSALAYQYGNLFNLQLFQGLEIIGNCTDYKMTVSCGDTEWVLTNAQAQEFVGLLNDREVNIGALLPASVSPQNHCRITESCLESDGELLERTWYLLEDGRMAWFGRPQTAYHFGAGYWEVYETASAPVYLADTDCSFAAAIAFLQSTAE